MRMTRGQAGAQRLRELDKAYRKTHAELHREFNKVFDAVMAKHGLSLTSLQDVHSFPLAFHEDPELLEAKNTFMLGQKLAAEVKQTSVAKLPSSAIRITRH